MSERRPDFSLRARLQLLVAGLVIVLVSGGVTVLAAVAARDEALDRIVSTLDPARDAAGDLRAALVDQQAAVAGYSLTAREEALDPYERNRSRQQAATRRLRALLADERRLRDRLRAVEEAATGWRTTVVGPQLSATRQGRMAESRALSATGEAEFAAVRTAVDDLQQSLDREIVRQRSEFDRTRQRLTRAVGANFVVAFLLLALTSVYVRRWITIPLEQLRTQASDVQEGRLTRPITIRGPRELTDVAEAVTRMRDRIVAELEDSERSREALAQQAPVVVMLRDVLAPAELVVPEGFRFATRFEPAEGVLAGDWYDLVDLGEGRVAVCVGDVAGHGAVPGLFALRARELVLIGLQLGLAPGEVLGLVARQLGELDEIFLTCVVVVVAPSPDGDVMELASAGHPPPLVLHPGGVSALERTGPLLGPLEAVWETRQHPLPAEWTVVCYTDGVVEAIDETGEEMGIDRLAGHLLAARPRGPQAMVDVGMAAVRAHMNSGRARDDVTIVALART